MQLKTVLVFFNIFTDLGDFSAIVIRLWLLAEHIYGLLIDFDVA